MSENFTPVLKMRPVASNKRRHGSLSLNGLMEDEYFIQNEYSQNLNRAYTAHEKKLKQIYYSRMMGKQTMYDDLDDHATSNGLPGGNMDEAIESRSAYVPPITRAIQLKILADLTAYPASFEYDTVKAEIPISDMIGVLDMFVNQQFSGKKNVPQMVMALCHFVESGTLVAEPYYYNQVEGRYKKNQDGKLEKGKEVSDLSLSFTVYDPLTVLVDPSASPGRVAETAEWCIVTHGFWPASRIEKEFGVKLSYDYHQRTMTIYGSDSIAVGETPNVYMRELQMASGLDNDEGIMVRKYMRASDGMEYTVIDDGYVVKKEINLLGVYGRLWLAWAPMIIDLDSPYGIPPAEEIRPSVEVIATIFNQVCDINAMNLKQPTYVFSGLIDKDSQTSSDSGYNQFVEVDPRRYLTSPGFEFDMEKLMRRFTIPALDQDSLFVFNNAMQSIWYVTGLNPTTLSGYQDKQVRVAGVAEMLNNSALRNTSTTVKNFETFFLNPIASEFLWILGDQYDKFPFLQQNGITREMITNISNVRVVNGSYLPADQSNKLQKATLVMQMAERNRTIDPVKATRFFLQQYGISLERFERDPLELLTEDQLFGLIEIARTQGQEGVMQFIQQSAQQMQAKKQGLL